MASGSSAITYAVLNIAGKSQKPLTDAFVLLGDDRRSALVVAADGMSFVGEARPEASGQLTIDVVDRDRLGAGSPPKVAVRVGDDQAPRLEHKLRGISSMITTHARLPGTLTVRDDFGLREVAAEWKTVEESPAAEAGAPRVETAFEPIAALFGSSRLMVTGPANAISLTTMALVAPLAAVGDALWPHPSP